MQIVIDIDEEEYQTISENKGVPYHLSDSIGNAILNGTPLSAMEEKSCATCGQPRNDTGDCILFMERKCVARYEKWISAKEGEK